jgi:hypothetical protein
VTYRSLVTKLQAHVTDASSTATPLLKSSHKCSESVTQVRSENNYQDFRLAGLVKIRFSQNTTDHFLIKPRLINNLPDHIKQADRLPEDSELGANWDRTHKVYRVIVKYSGKSGTTRSTEPVKFITNTRNNTDNWYCLV